MKEIISKLVDDGSFLILALMIAFMIFVEVVNLRIEGSRYNSEWE